MKITINLITDLNIKMETISDKVKMAIDKQLKEEGKE